MYIVHTFHNFVYLRHVKCYCVVKAQQYIIEQLLFNDCRWRMVVHGGVDGFSRFVVFLKCSTNNLSDTVLQLFKAAVREYGLPHQVRGDQGGENVKVLGNFCQCVCLDFFFN